MSDSTDSSFSRIYLQPEPMLENPSRLMLNMRLNEAGVPSAYGYADQNPISNYDDDGLTTRQYRRDGTGSRAAEVMHKSGHKGAAEACAKRANDILSECLKKEKCEEPPALPKKPTTSDLRMREEFIMKAMKERDAKCDKIARCTDVACLAAFGNLNAVSPAEIREFEKCMNSK